eukprot:TRINITY_DN6044_c0_g1_i4.p1 TRINITY_DN6044_c0_g1~~TRINITY_DN6044_c0_g1_i4.p1  ORF type:complete len:104 (-),score=6.43 TRINITY_DN6044_c0_g1_i4:54-365(-)
MFNYKDRKSKIVQCISNSMHGSCGRHGNKDSIRHRRPPIHMPGVPGHLPLRSLSSCTNPPVLCVDTCLLYTSRAHETPEHLVCRLLLEKKKTNSAKKKNLKEY